MFFGEQRVVIAGLRLLLRNEAGFTVVGNAMTPRVPDGRTTGAATAWVPSFDGTATADVIILDIDDGAEAWLPVLAGSVSPGTRLMILASALDQHTLTRVFRHGVTGAVLKHETLDVLLTAIRTVHEGQIWLDPASTTQLVTGLAVTPETIAPEARRAASLTRRERQVVAVVGEGLRNLQVADRLSISEVTVRNHLTSIFRKLHVANRFQLSLYALKHGLSKPPPRFRLARLAAARVPKARRTSAS